MLPDLLRLKPKSVGEGKKAGDDHDHDDQHMQH